MILTSSGCKCLIDVGENELYMRKFRVSVNRCIVHDKQDLSILGSHLSVEHFQKIATNR